MASRAAPRAAAPPARTASDRSSYIEFLEMQLERVTGACAQVQGVAAQVENAEQKIQNLVRLVQLCQSLIDSNEAQQLQRQRATDARLDALEGALRSLRATPSLAPLPAPAFDATTGSTASAIGTHLSLAQLEALIDSRLESTHHAAPALSRTAPSPAPVVTSQRARTVSAPSSPRHAATKHADAVVLERRLSTALAEVRDTQASVEQRFTSLFERHTSDTRTAWAHAQRALVADLEERVAAVAHRWEARTPGAQLDQLSAYVDAHLERLGARVDAFGVQHAAAEAERAAQHAHAERTWARLVEDVVRRTDAAQRDAERAAADARSHADAQRSSTQSAVDALRTHMEHALERRDRALHAAIADARRRVRSVAKRANKRAVSTLAAATKSLPPPGGHRHATTAPASSTLPSSSAAVADALSSIKSDLLAAVHAHMRTLSHTVDARVREVEVAAAALRVRQQLHDATTLLSSSSSSSTHAVPPAASHIGPVSDAHTSPKPVPARPAIASPRAPASPPRVVHTAPPPPRSPSPTPSHVRAPVSSHHTASTASLASTSSSAALSEFAIAPPDDRRASAVARAALRATNGGVLRSSLHNLDELVRALEATDALDELEEAERQRRRGGARTTAATATFTRAPPAPLWK